MKKQYKVGDLFQKPHYYAKPGKITGLLIDIQTVITEVYTIQWYYADDVTETKLCYIKSEIDTYCANICDWKHYPA